jgi:hypothetical protein
LNPAAKRHADAVRRRLKQVKVKYGGKGAVTIPAESTDLVSLIVDKLKVKFSLGEDAVVTLKFGEATLAPEQTLAAYDVDHNATIVAEVEIPLTQVKITCGKETYTMKVTPETTVLDLKAEILTSVAFPIAAALPSWNLAQNPECQVLHFGTIKLVGDAATLDEHGLKHNCVLKWKLKKA